MADRKQKKLAVQLFIAGDSGVSLRATANIKSMMRQHCGEDDCTLEIIDILENPIMAFKNKIRATPTLIKRHPGPEKRIIGDLSVSSPVLACLGFYDDPHLADDSLP